MVSWPFWPGVNAGMVTVQPGTTGLSVSVHGVESGSRTMKVVRLSRPLMSWSPVHHAVRPGAYRAEASG